MSSKPLKTKQRADERHHGNGRRKRGDIIVRRDQPIGRTKYCPDQIEGGRYALRSKENPPYMHNGHRAEPSCQPPPEPIALASGVIKRGKSQVCRAVDRTP